MDDARLRPPRDAARVVKALGIAGWVVVAISAAVSVLLTPTGTQQANQVVLMVAMALLSVILISRLVLAAVIWSARRLALVALTIGIALWLIGSAILNGTSPTQEVTFPAPGEGFFLASYVGFVAFLLLDAATRHGRAETAWLDAAIVVGGTGAVAGALLMTPFASLFPESGLALLLALLYPLIDRSEEHTSELQSH